MNEKTTFNTAYSPSLPFPDKVVLQRLTFSRESESETYFKRKYCYAMMHLLDDEGTIGTCQCSCCKKQMDIFDKFCPNCGAKSKGRKIVNGDSDETD